MNETDTHIQTHVDKIMAVLQEHMTRQQAAEHVSKLLRAVNVNPARYLGGNRVS